MEKTSTFQEPLFKRIVVASTGLGLASMLTSLAALRIGKTVGLQFVWHWSLLVVIALSLVCNSLFWRSLWELQENPRPNSKKRVGGYVALMLALGLACFLYPIRFIEQSYLGGISRGLVTAALFLATLAWLVFKTGKILSDIDKTELERLENMAQS